MLDLEGELIVERCKFKNNKTGAGGGGIFLFGSHARVRNCDFIDNEGLGDGGGAIYSQGMSFRGANELTGEFVNCRFVGNNGVIVAVQAAFVDFINCTMAHNSLQDQFLIWPVVFVQGPDATVRFLNSVIWGNGVEAFAQGGVVGGTGFTILDGNIEIETSCVEHWDNSVPGNNNFAINPQFVNAFGIDGISGTVDDDVRVQMNSVCVDAGNNAFVPIDVMTDLDDHPRIINADNIGMPIVDLGAYEKLRLGDLNADGVVNVTDLFQLLSNWGTNAPGANLAPPTNIIDVGDLFILLANWGG